MRKIAVCLSKGGVGKTTTATTLAYGLSQSGRKVLLVDCDTQGQAAFFLGLRPELGIAEVLLGRKAANECIVEARPNLHLLASGGRLLGEATAHISTRTLGIERALLEALTHVEGHYDYVILDMAPGWDILTVNALIYAKEILAPVQLQGPSMESLGEFFERVDIVRQYNAGLDTKYIVPTNWDRRSGESRALYEQLMKMFPEKTCSPVRQCVKIFEASGRGQVIFEYAPKSTGAEDYGNLIERIKQDDKESCHGC